MDILDILYRLKGQRVPWIFCLRANQFRLYRRFAAGNACSNIVLQSYATSITCLRHCAVADPSPWNCRHSVQKEPACRLPKLTVSKMFQAFSKHLRSDSWNKGSGWMQSIEFCPFYPHMPVHNVIVMAFCSRACEVFLHLN